jgi:hypothetical protein
MKAVFLSDYGDHDGFVVLIMMVQGDDDGFVFF